MIEIEDRDETLEAQEELIRLEREKTVGLVKSLSKERKSFKVQEDLLNAKDGKLLKLETSLAKENSLMLNLENMPMMRPSCSLDLMVVLSISFSL